MSHYTVPLELQALLEIPMRRLQNVKTLICWPSRMQIYGSVGPRLEGFEIELFWSIDSTHDEDPKRKNVALLVF